MGKSANLAKVFRVASFVSWGSLRNAKTAIIAFQQFRLINRDAEYHLYGSGFENLGLAHRWAAREGLADNLFFHGYIDHEKVAGEMRNADIVIHPSLEESFSMIVAEAMTLGVPVIGGIASGGVPWVLDNGRAGLLVDVRKPVNIASALQRLYENRNLWEYLASNGQARARSLFTPEAVLPKYEEIYDHLLSEALS
jgi:glycosyltransferase involved in cell wall biosynthesis